jgi:hypothetical protein
MLTSCWLKACSVVVVQIGACWPPILPAIPLGYLPEQGGEVEGVEKKQQTAAPEEDLHQDKPADRCTPSIHFWAPRQVMPRQSGLDNAPVPQVADFAAGPCLACAAGVLPPLP